MLYHGVFPSFLIYDPLATIRCWIYLPRCDALLLEFRFLGKHWQDVPLCGKLSPKQRPWFWSQFYWGAYVSLWESWGGGRRCSHESGETDGGQGEPVGRYPEGKTPDFTLTLIEVRKAKESNWQKSFQSSQEKKGKGKESMGQGIS